MCQRQVGGRFSDSLIRGKVAPKDLSYTYPGEHPQLRKAGVTLDCHFQDDVPLVAVTRRQGTLAREQESHGGRRRT